MSRKRVRERNGTVVTTVSVIWLWPAERIIVSIQAVRTHVYFAGVAQRGSGNEVLVGRGNEISSIEEKGADFAISRGKRCYSREFSEKACHELRNQLTTVNFISQ
jgi:hypothetical protein